MSLILALVFCAERCGELSSDAPSHSERDDVTHALVAGVCLCAVLVSISAPAN